MRQFTLSAAMGIALAALLSAVPAMAQAYTSLGEVLGITFQQIQKYEKGTNRIGASGLQQIAHILQVPVSFFFEDLPLPSEALSEEGAYIDDFLATSDGLSLTKYFMCIKDPKLRRSIVDLVEHIAARYD